MSEFSKERVQKHLQNLAIQIKVLKDWQKQSSDFFSDPKNAYSVYHAFLLAIQNVMDIGGHILASVFNKGYSEYEEIAPLLFEYEVIDQQLAGRMKGLAGFRNKLAHDYIEIDADKVYEYLQNEVDVFIIYSQTIVEFMEKMK